MLEEHKCHNKVAIQAQGKSVGCMHQNQVVVNLCETEQVEALEWTATREDAAFLQMQTETMERKLAADYVGRLSMSICVRQMQKKTLESKQRVQVNLGFSDYRGNVVNVQLEKRPLGINFACRQTPLEVKSCTGGSHAQECGIKVGMVLTTIQGESISRETYDKAWEKLTVSVSKLPGL